MRNPLLLVKIARAAITLVRDPDRLDEVFTIADQLQQTESLDAIIAHVIRDPQGARALDERPRIALDLPAFRKLPDGSFGREVVRYYDEQRLDPSALPYRPAPDGRAFVRAHLYETHDLWHVVTGFGTDVAGEVGLQAFYLAQLPARLAAVLIGIVYLNTFLYRFDDKDARTDAVARGWTLGRAAHPLFGARWNDLWELPLTEVRARFGIPAAGVERPCYAAAA